MRHDQGLAGHRGHCLESGAGRAERSGVELPVTSKICCAFHGRNCEPPSELCCDGCTEAAHDTFPFRHADGSRCSAPDLSVHMWLDYLSAREVDHGRKPDVQRP